jgi:hypothetical protein
MDNERDEDIAELIGAWLDSDLSAQGRFAAIDTLIERSPDIAKPVLLAVAERTAEPRLILEAAGMGLARIERSGVKVSEFDMRNMCEVAFLAWDGWRPPK